jgi:uncharacterized OsmC-like protein
MSTTLETRTNGVDVGALVSAIEAMKQDPDRARLTFKASAEWAGGARTRTTIDRTFAAEIDTAATRTSATIHADEPRGLLGTNTAPNPVEVILSAIASCLSVGYAYNAAARGIEIDAIDFTLEGDLDLQGFLGLSDEVRPGYENVRITAHIASSAPPEQIRELVEHVHRTSPVLDIIRNPVPVTVDVVTN